VAYKNKLQISQYCLKIVKKDKAISIVKKDKAISITIHRFLDSQLTDGSEVY
jgi:hypothetical protein